MRVHRSHTWCSPSRSRWQAMGVLLLMLSAQPVLADTAQDAAVFASWPLDKVKQAYLECDRTSSRELIPPGVMVHCVMIGDTLRQRGFDGNFDRLLAWWRSEKNAAAATAASPEFVSGSVR